MAHTRTRPNFSNLKCAKEHTFKSSNWHWFFVLLLWKNSLPIVGISWFSRNTRNYTFEKGKMFGLSQQYYSLSLCGITSITIFRDVKKSILQGQLQFHYRRQNHFLTGQNPDQDWTNLSRVCMCFFPPKRIVYCVYDAEQNNNSKKLNGYKGNAISMRDKYDSLVWCASAAQPLHRLCVMYRLLFGWHPHHKIEIYAASSDEVSQSQGIQKIPSQM